MEFEADTKKRKKAVPQKRPGKNPPLLVISPSSAIVAKLTPSQPADNAMFAQLESKMFAEFQAIRQIHQSSVSALSDAFSLNEQMKPVVVQRLRQLSVKMFVEVP